MLFKNITILDENLEVQHGMFVGIKDKKIDYIGKEAPEAAFDHIYGSEIYDGKGKLLMSGFYNTHSHSAMTLMRGYGENLSLQRWLEEKVYPFEDFLTGEAVYWGTMLAIAESLRSGIVSSTDMYFFTPNMCKAVVNSGAKMNIAQGVVNFTNMEPKELPQFIAMKELIEFYDMMGMGRVKADACIHAEYTSNPETCIEVGNLAYKKMVNMHVHLSETQFEHEECKRKYGKTPAKYMADLGLFDVPATAAHCVWLEDDDMDILAKKKVTVASCPTSNLKLASGIADIPKMLKKGINVTIGTDSVCSNNSLDFFSEMKLMALLPKYKYSDPTVVTPTQVLHMATRAGAVSQGRKDCGSVKVGNRADLIVVNLDAPNMHPLHDLKTNLVYSASSAEVKMTMVEGKILYRNGEFLTIDIEQTIQEVEKATSQILSKL